jgi:hypothetical protein
MTPTLIVTGPLNPHPGPDCYRASKCCLFHASVIDIVSPLQVQLLERLQSLLRDRESSPLTVEEVMDYFLKRLSSPQVRLLARAPVRQTMLRNNVTN